ncbi:formate/nitrite transporter family protein [Faecalimonas sp.]
MKQNFFSGLMAGTYIALGAITFLIIPNQIVASLFFATGIFLVFNFSNMLFTRVCPLMIATKEYGIKDLIVTWMGNGVGTFIIATLIHFCRFEDKILERLQPIVDTKLSDSPLSLFIMGIICAVFVSYAVFLGKKYPKGSFPQIFYVWLLITAFVFGGYDHIVANMYYLSAYGWAFGVEIIPFLKVLGIVTAGNIVGGLLIGSLEKKHL